MKPKGLLPCSKETVGSPHDGTPESFNIHLILHYIRRQGLQNDPIPALKFEVIMAATIKVVF